MVCWLKNSMQLQSKSNYIVIESDKLVDSKMYIKDSRTLMQSKEKQKNQTNRKLKMTNFKVRLKTKTNIEPWLDSPHDSGYVLLRCLQHDGDMW